MSERQNQAALEQALSHTTHYSHTEAVREVLVKDCITLAAEGRWQRDEIVWRDEVLIMVVVQLKALGCCHESGHEDATPPYCYGDWIRCCVAKREKEIDSLKKQIGTLREAIARSGQDLAPCLECGEPVVSVPDGLAMCVGCAEQNN